jgi:hypothetical protein
MSDPVVDDRRRALSEARSALAIVHAQYWRALTRAATAGPARRASALVEARRLVGVAVALRGRIAAQGADAIAESASATSPTAAKRDIPAPGSESPDPRTPGGGTGSDR